jgi:hypothetical protein
MNEQEMELFLKQMEMLNGSEEEEPVEEEEE